MMRLAVLFRDVQLTTVCHGLASGLLDGVAKEELLNLLGLNAWRHVLAIEQSLVQELFASSGAGCPISDRSCTAEGIVIFLKFLWVEVWCFWHSGGGGGGGGLLSPAMWTFAHNRVFRLSTMK